MGKKRIKANYHRRVLRIPDLDLLEAENPKSKTLLMNTLPLCQLMSPLLFTLNHKLNKCMG